MFPFAKALQIKIPSKWYRRSIGGTEIFAGRLIKRWRDRQINKIWYNYKKICKYAIALIKFRLILWKFRKWHKGISTTQILPRKDIGKRKRTVRLIVR